MILNVIPIIVEFVETFAIVLQLSMNVVLNLKKWEKYEAYEFDECFSGTNGGRVEEAQTISMAVGTLIFNTDDYYCLISSAPCILMAL